MGLWRCLVLGFHCKAPYFPIKSLLLSKTLLVCWSLSIRNKSTNHKKNSFVSRSENEIVNSYTSIRRSANKCWNSWLRLAPGSWHAHGLFGKSGRGTAENKLMSWNLSPGRRLKTEDRAKAPQKTPTTLHVLWGRDTPWIALSRLLCSVTLAKDLSHSASTKTYHFTGLWARCHRKMETSSHPLQSLKKFYRHFARGILLAHG